MRLRLLLASIPFLFAQTPTTQAQIIEPQAIKKHDDQVNLYCLHNGNTRSTRDLLNTLDVISNAGATFKSLGDPWADTTTPHGRLMLTVLGGPAEFERHLILAQTSEGRTRAQARGVRFGRKPSLTAHQRKRWSDVVVARPWSKSRRATTSATPLFRDWPTSREPQPRA
jgi:Resolvase, N terminal domain